MQEEISQLLKEKEPSIEKIVDCIVSQAILTSASDIHIEPKGEGLVVRYRVDGVLRDVFNFPKELSPSLISRLKVISKLVIYRKRRPQDGRIQAKHKDEEVDLRVSFLPTIRGERVVIRIHPKDEDLFSIDELGFSSEMEERFKELILRPQGTILLTGPASSGKTTTIYAALTYIHSTKKESASIITIEDPVEHELDFIAQTQVDPAGGFTFASGLRSILRQDPNVIVVGEIRDEETARIAIQAGFTGHLVISTIHAGSTGGVFSRLINMGIEPYLVASSISGVLAQRLTRMICPDCKEPYIPDSHFLSSIEECESLDKQQFFRGRGCKRCNMTGFKGRTAIFELLIVNEELSELIARKPTTSELRFKARQMGMRSLRQEGIKKALAGITTLEEVMRVT